MKAAVFHGTKDIRFEEVATPQLEEGEALRFGVVIVQLAEGTGRVDRETRAFDALRTNAAL